MLTARLTEAGGGHDKLRVARGGGGVAEGSRPCERQGRGRDRRRWPRPARAPADRASKLGALPPPERRRGLAVGREGVALGERREAGGGGRTRRAPLGVAAGPGECVAAGEPAGMATIARATLTGIGGHTRGQTAGRRKAS